jgi:hypothetical protein
VAAVDDKEEEVDTQSLPASPAKLAIQNGAEIAREAGKLAITRAAKRFSD